MVPKAMLVDAFVYREFVGKGRDHAPKYDEPIEVSNVRIDRIKTYGESQSEASVRANATIYAYEALTEPFVAFKEQSKVQFDGREYVIVDVRTLKHWYLNDVMAYELDVM